MMEVKTLELNEELKTVGISGIYYSNESIEIHFADSDKVISLPVLKWQHETIMQLYPFETDGLINGNQLTQLLYFLNLELPKIWDDISVASNGYKEERRTNKSENKKKIPIRKCTANGTIPLHECIIIGNKPKFVTLDQNKEPIFKNEIETDTEIFIPNDTIYTQTPLPYIFKSEEEFREYLGYAKTLDLDSLFNLVETEYRKYVDVEGYYYTLLAGDTIWSYFQDVFPYTHYIIIVGDNDAGKNSALLAYKYLGYRPFYVTSASAANYYTVLGNKEEGQVTIAEDEAEDIAKDKDKRNVFKTGYATGGSIPKVELDGGRRQDNWLTYCYKISAVEELPTDLSMKGVLDRSFVLRFVTGSPQYNIKEVVRTGKDPEYESLYDKLMHIRKILFCYRLLHREDQFLNVKLNIKNRISELTKPLIRLFYNAPLTRQRILDDLSIFMNERNQNKKGSFEAKLYYVIIRLIKERAELINKGTLNAEQLRAFGTHRFSNEIIRDTCKEEMDGHEIVGKDTAFYSPEFGTVSQKMLTSILKSKFKAKKLDPIHIDNTTVRCLEFEQKYLDKIKSYYDMPDKIQILEPATDATDATVPSRVNKDLEDNLGPESKENYSCTLLSKQEKIMKNSLEPSNNTEKDSPTHPTSVASVAENEEILK